MRQLPPDVGCDAGRVAALVKAALRLIDVCAEFELGACLFCRCMPDGGSGGTWQVAAPLQPSAAAWFYI